MSFVILRNRDNQPPNAFDNEFQNTITIPANSEVALHSMALNKQDKFVLNNARLYVYHGPTVGADTFAADNSVAPVRRPVQIELMNGAYSATELAAHVQEQLRLQDDHPNYQQLWTCTAAVTNNEFTGLNIECKQIAPATPAVASIPSDIVKVSTDGSTFSYGSPTAGTLTCNTTDVTDLLCACTEHPMNLNGGQFIIDFSGMHDLATVPPTINRSNRIGIGHNYEIFDNRFKAGYFDMFVKFDENANVQVFFSVMNTLTNAVEEIQIAYWNDTDSDFTDLSTYMNLVNKPTGHKTIDYKQLQFGFVNEQVTIRIGNITGGFETLVSTSLPPLSSANSAVYPKVFLAQNRSCKFDHQDAVSSYKPVHRPESEFFALDPAFQLMVMYADDTVYNQMNRLSGNTFNWPIKRGVTNPGSGKVHHLAYDCGLVIGFVDPTTFLQVDDASVDQLFGHQPIVFSSPVAEVDTSYGGGAGPP